MGLGVHFSAAQFEYVPSGHVLHSSAPSTSLYSPLLQEVQKPGVYVRTEYGSGHE